MRSNLLFTSRYRLELV